MTTSRYRITSCKNVIVLLLLGSSWLWTIVGGQSSGSVEGIRNSEYFEFWIEMIVEQEGSTAPNMEAALELVTNEVRSTVNDKMKDGYLTGMLVQVITVNDTQPCPFVFQSDECVLVNSTVLGRVTRGRDIDLVQRAFIAEMDLFLPTFHDQNPNIRVFIRYPVEVSAAIRLAFVGLGTKMNGNGREVLEMSFTQVFQPLLAGKDPPYTIHDVQVRLQEVVTGGRRKLQQETTPPALTANLFVRSYCQDDIDGTCDDGLYGRTLEREFYVNGNTTMPLLQAALEQNGQTAGTDFFQATPFELQPLLFTATEDMANFEDDDILYYQEPSMNTGKMPVWMWISIMGSVLIMLLGTVLFVARSRFQAEKKLKEKTKPSESLIEKDAMAEEQEAAEQGDAVVADDESHQEHVDDYDEQQYHQQDYGEDERLTQHSEDDRLNQSNYIDDSRPSFYDDDDYDRRYQH